MEEVFTLDFPEYICSLSNELFSPSDSLFLEICLPLMSGASLCPSKDRGGLNGSVREASCSGGESQAKRNFGFEKNAFLALGEAKSDLKLTKNWRSPFGTLARYFWEISLRYFWQHSRGSQKL